MPKTVERIALISNSAGSERHLLVHRYGRPGARPKAYLQASLHADEIPAMLVQHHLIRLLDAADAAGQIRGEILAVPAANPIGLGQYHNFHHVGRYDAGGGGNFNRNWPDLSAGIAERVKDRLGRDAAANVAVIRRAMGEKLAAMTPHNEFSSLRLALARLAYDADIVLDLHCDSEALMHLYLIPAHWPEARDLAAELASAAQMLADDSGGGSFDESMSAPWVKLAKAIGPEKPVPPACFAATVEFRGQVDVDDALAEPDARAIFRFLQRRGLVAGDPGPLPPLLAEATPFEATEIPRSPIPGIAAYRQRVGARLRKGDLLCEIVDPMATDIAKARVPVHAGTDGLLLARAFHKSVRPGDSLGKIVGTVPLPSRQGYLLED
jgi:predicted deacylase